MKKDPPQKRPPSIPATLPSTFRLKGPPPPRLTDEQIRMVEEWARKRREAAAQDKH
jgi:hypothetical protein